MKDTKKTVTTFDYSEANEYLFTVDKKYFTDLLHSYGLKRGAQRLYDTKPLLTITTKEHGFISIRFYMEKGCCEFTLKAKGSHKQPVREYNFDLREMIEFVKQLKTREKELTFLIVNGGFEVVKLNGSELIRANEAGFLIRCVDSPLDFRNLLSYDHYDDKSGIDKLEFEDTNELLRLFAKAVACADVDPKTYKPILLNVHLEFLSELGMVVSESTDARILTRNIMNGLYDLEAVGKNYNLLVDARSLSQILKVIPSQFRVGTEAEILFDGNRLVIIIGGSECTLQLKSSENTELSFIPMGELKRGRVYPDFDRHINLFTKKLAFSLDSQELRDGMNRIMELAVDESEKGDKKKIIRMEVENNTMVLSCKSTANHWQPFDCHVSINIKNPTDVKQYRYFNGLLLTRVMDFLTSKELTLEIGESTRDGLLFTSNNGNAEYQDVSNFVVMVRRYSDDPKYSTK